MATHATNLDLPRPYRAAAPLIALAVAAALFDVDPRLPWLVGVAGAGFFGAAALLRAVRARHELAAVRRTADRLIVYEPRGNDASELVRWRCDELTSAAARTALKREIDRLLDELDPRRLPGASPLRRPALRANEALLRQIGNRIGGSQPISARGIVLTRALLRDGASPIYAEGADLLLPRALARVRGALEP